MSGEREFGGKQDAYYDVLLQDTLTLENLGRSAALAQVMRNNMTDRQTVLHVPSLILEDSQIPAEVRDIYSFREVRITDFTANLQQLPDIDNTPSWSLGATFVAENSHFRLDAQPLDHSTLVWESPTSDRVIAELGPGVATRFLAALAVGAIQNEGYERGGILQEGMLRLREEVADNLQYPERRTRPTSFADSPDAMNRIMQEIARHTGMYESRFSAYISMLALDRTLLIKQIETENSFMASQQLDYRMVWKPGKTLLTDMSSHQLETIYRVTEESTYIRYASRSDSGIEPDSLECDLPETGHRQFFNPSADRSDRRTREAYLNINTAVMALLTPLLAEYAQLDSDPIVEADSMVMHLTGLGESNNYIQGLVLRPEQP